MQAADIRLIPRSVGSLFALILVLNSCNYGDVTIVDPPQLEAEKLTLTILPDSEALPAARILGWEQGIPDAEVTLTRVQEGASDIRIVRTNSSGVAVFDNATGSYTIDARRWLAPNETSRLGGSTVDVVGFVGSGQVKVTRGSEASVAAAPSRRRGLVISEWAFNFGHIPNVGTYYLGGFLELYNNGDSTVFLDRLIVGEGYNLSIAVPYASCADQVPFKRDPDYIWTLRMHQMPGSGRQYPLLPGKTAVLATDAIDHRPIIANALDLRSADFEFIGTADVDNPAVPNILNIGFGNDPFGHGFFGDILASALFIATPLDLSALPRRPHPRNSTPYMGIPRRAVLEAIALQTQSELSAELCGDQLHYNFDRGSARYTGGGTADSSFTRSAERRVAIALPGGRKVLQHTRNTALDFFIGTRSPGRLP